MIPISRAVFGLSLDIGKSCPIPLPVGGGAKLKPGDDGYAARNACTGCYCFSLVQTLL